jgi:hypothetical protein
MKKLIVGVSGTRYDLKDRERDVISITLHQYRPDTTIVVSGACTGVDSVALRLAHEMGMENWVYVPHVGKNRWLDTGYNAYADRVVNLPFSPDPYGDRDRAVVDVSDVMHFFPLYPEDDTRSRRSGTWMTVRISRQKGNVGSITILEDV